MATLAAAYAASGGHYVEPFAGSAALFFSLSPQSALLADLNGHLVNALRYVRDCPEEIYRRLSKLGRSEIDYYKIRSAFNNCRPFGIEAAVFFVYLNRNCFNGLWRTNLKGEFNVPYGGKEIGENPPLALFEVCSTSLKRATLRHQDFRKTISSVAEEAFIYADPPYFTTSQRVFVEYGSKSFGKEDLRDLIKELILATRRGAAIVLSYHHSLIADALPSTWRKTAVQVTRNVGGFSGSRKVETEMLWTNLPIESVT